MRNRHAYHDFQPFGTEDMGQGYICVKIRCDLCKEERSVGAPIDQVNRTGGCLRRGPDKPWQKGDQLILPGGYLDEFEAMLPDDMVLSWNAGGHWSRTPLAEVRPQE